MSNSGYTISNFRSTLQEKLKQYIEAQYHIKNDGLVRQRRDLLSGERVLSTETFIETNRRYKKCDGYFDSGLNGPVRQVFDELSKQPSKTGVVPTPFSHQIEAINKFVEKQQNIVISTGTGSGKTESFLYPILANLLELSKDCSGDGVMKSMILYPMNALVADQTTRLRKLVGSTESQTAYKRAIGRTLKFANYTSATPYAGSFDKKKNKFAAGAITKLFSLEQSEEAKQYFDVLSQHYKIPKKDNLSKFAELLKSASSVHQLMNEDDPELLMRAEIQSNQPDLLVTNFSMLEYMLLRPIEQLIFDRTKQWLKKDKSHNFTLVLDEAHIYNGVSGSEVALLLRRLRDRLGADEMQFRVILASASLGENDDVIKDNASKLTGVHKDTFTVIKHQDETLIDRWECNSNILEILDCLDPSEIANYTTSSVSNQKMIEKSLLNILKFRGKTVEEALNGSIDELAYKALEGLDLFNGLKKLLVEPHASNSVVEHLENYCASKGYVSTNSQKLFETIINLGSLAAVKNELGTEVLLPIRAHNMFRGLPGLFICINKHCGTEDNPFGKMYPDKRTTCDCGSKVYELYTHRECGSAYIKGYWSKGGEGQDLGGLTLYPDGGVHKKQELSPVYICIDEHTTDNARVVYINPRTGVITDEPSSEYLKTSISHDTNNFSYRVVETLSGAEKAWFHKDCQYCGYESIVKSNNESTDSNEIVGALEVKPLGTIGDEPFSYLVKEQFRLQPVSNPSESRDTNQGRKSLIFSDGRQKAARIAKNLPETIQRDVFRSYFIKAYSWLQTGEAKAVLCDDDFELSRITETLDPYKLYFGFLKVCSDTGKLFFEGKDRLTFSRHLDDFKNFRTISSESIPNSFLEYLIAILCKPRYNIIDLAIAGIRARPAKKIAQRTGIHIDLVEAFLAKRARDFLQVGAINLDKDIVSQVLNYSSDGKKKEWRLSQKSAHKYARRNQGELVSPENYKILNDYFVDKILVRVPGSDEDLYNIDLGKLYINIGVDNTWFECQHCLYLSDVVLPDGRCSACGKPKSYMKTFYVDSDYFIARKLFWRDPIRQAIIDIQDEMFIEVGEHTAQLNYRDNNEKIISTVSENELKFQDILDPRSKYTCIPVDILSSTTTMEVGIDIGGLIAVAMRNVPPQRQNYQQRAGRAGRRGSSFSTVVTYSQNGSHDSYYFNNPTKMIAGPMAPIRLDPEQRRLAFRHYLSVVIGHYFHCKTVELAKTETKSPDIFSHLGSLRAFLGDEEPNINGLKAWVFGDGRSDIQQLTKWYASLMGEIADDELLAELEALNEILNLRLEELETEGITDGGGQYLLDVLFDVAKLPSYAFPTDLVQLEIFKSDGNKIVPDERPTFGISQAIQELAPGRALVINKNQYQVGSVLSDSVYGRGRSKAANLFKLDKMKVYFICGNCNTLHKNEETSCCSDKKLRRIEVIKPQYVVPKNVKGRNLKVSDIVYTSSQEAQIVNNGNVVQGSEDKCRRFKAEHKIYRSEGVRIARLNNGIPQRDGRGFMVCTRCGATSPPHNFNDGFHYTDYPVEVGGRTASTCSGEIRQVSIGYDFQTDLSSLIFKLSNDFELPDGVLMPAPLESAANSLSLAIRNAFAIFKDISQSDLGFGTRTINRDDSYWIELYFYDENSGGAGYASDVASVISQILSHAEKLLTDCNCDSRCYNCLSSYDTRFIDHKLNRHLGLALLRYIRDEVLELDGDSEINSQLLASLKLELESIDFSFDGKHVNSVDGKCIEIKLRPSLSIESGSEKDVVSITPHELANDLAPIIEKIKTKVVR
ncbi:DEAD/DEAH box helicase [Vibrio harveyi]